MPKTTMRKYLRKPGKKTGSQKKSNWRSLYNTALERAEESGDARLCDLKHLASDPERAMRKLSILSEVDLNREFPV